MGKNTPHDNVYAVIDLGSNSFHMLIAKSISGSLQTIGRVKRKVRLAAGLDEQNQLSKEAMQRGWECLTLFAERLQDIPKQNVTIVATATLRLAKNAAQFKQKAEQILSHPINVISGEEEANTIYKGVAHTSACNDKQLVIDIGGASTEVVIGQQFDPLHSTSLNMGCVTYIERYFKDGKLSQQNFTNAINSAKKQIETIAETYKSTGWQQAAGASGTVQAVQEIMLAQWQEETLTLERLHNIQRQTVLYETIEELHLHGLSEERRLVFVSGLAILIALFETLEIETMSLAGGALREGVLYSMLPNFKQQDIRERTLHALTTCYHIDMTQAELVNDVAQTLAKQVSEQWQLCSSDLALLKAAAYLHELGLLIEYKRYPQHGAYILLNTDMPGYSNEQRKLIANVITQHWGDIDVNHFYNFEGKHSTAQHLTRILRLAVILSMRRKSDVLPDIQLSIEKEQLTLCIEKSWIEKHPLMLAELEQEKLSQLKANWQLEIKSA